MSHALLIELNQELRRLYIAGSDLAAEDFRLKRLLPSFQQLGERAPVFKKLAEGIDALISGGSGADSAVRLQDVNLLLQSVLRTQGKGGAEGQTSDLYNKAVNLPTSFSYRRLSPVRTALTTRGGGRHEIIVGAFREGIFQDLRLLPLAIEALNDPYVEIAEFVMTDILPSYGPALVPHLIESFNPEGGRLEARKLIVMAKSGGEEVLKLIYEAAMAGSNEVRTTAIRLLADHAEYEQVLLDLSHDKKKNIREAAYQGLAESSWDSAAERLYEASKGKDSELVGPSLSRSQSELLSGWLIRDLAELVHIAEDTALNKEKREELRTQAVRYFWAVSRKESQELEQIYLKVLRNYKHFMFTLGWTFLVNEAMNYLKSIGSEEGRELMKAAIELDLKKYAGTHSYAGDVFVKAQPILSPERLYEEYSALLNGRKHASAASRSVNTAKQLLDTMESMVINRRYQMIRQEWAYGEEGYAYKVEIPSQEEIAATWDSRWLDHFIELDRMNLVSVFARPGHAEVASFLLKKLRHSPEFRNRFANIAVIGLVRAGVSEEVLHEALIQAVEDERNTECREIEPFLFEQLNRLPAVYADRLRACLHKFTFTSSEQLEFILKNMESSIHS
ncbi:HEAT repeat domain-containing protein [Paenibacillus sp. CAA11]|uniref:HEAT repeat domain-containing protein n=1 Tax=Paenibacillus sp. CAA11 TaxID=1532905 RepID=UPI000D3396C0|nr:HEAT repeat domain-containing protein [Paenibacillus sp. CAA11]AWB44635.1 HEAT repeat domain-containing protein [Paenibacillus sp. CAA11]